MRKKFLAVLVCIFVMLGAVQASASVIGTVSAVLVDRLTYAFAEWISDKAVDMLNDYMKRNGLNVSTLKAKAEAGDEDAQYYLGVIYENGRNVKRDYYEAIRWYRKSADQGYARAQNAL